MLGPFATASRRTRHSPGVATVARRHCRTPPAHRCPRRRRRQQQRQRVTEGTAMAPWNGPNKKVALLSGVFSERRVLGRLGVMSPFSLFLIHCKQTTFRSGCAIHT